MVVLFRLVPQHLAMAKELTDRAGPPNVFQLFNQNRTYYFESDISSLPMPPQTVAPTRSTTSAPKLRKCHSLPQLSVTDCATNTSDGNSSGTQNTPSSLHLPAAVMAPISLSESLRGTTSITNASSVETRYQTEPSYSSSHILKSFKSEFKLFGNIQSRTGRSSTSNPVTPRGGSPNNLDCDTLEKVYPDKDRDSRKLSLVREEVVEQVKYNDTSAALALPISETLTNSEDKKAKSQAEKQSLLSKTVTDTIDGQSLRGERLPLTKQMMNWLTTTPQSQVKVNRSEFNAISPSSF